MRQVFHIMSSKRFNHNVSFKGDDVIVAATGQSLTFDGPPPNEHNIVSSPCNSKHGATGPWLISMPAECKAIIAKPTFLVGTISKGKTPSTMISLNITVATENS